MYNVEKKSSHLESHINVNLTNCKYKIFMWKNILIFLHKSALLNMSITFHTNSSPINIKSTAFTHTGN